MGKVKAKTEVVAAVERKVVISINLRSIIFFSVLIGENSSKLQ